MSGRNWRIETSAQNRYGAYEEGIDFEESKVEHATAKALLILRDGKKFWLPKSVIAEGSEIRADSEIGTEGTLSIQRHWCEKEGLEP